MDETRRHLLNVIWLCFYDSLRLFISWNLNKNFVPGSESFKNFTVNGFDFCCYVTEKLHHQVDAAFNQAFLKQQP